MSEVDAMPDRTRERVRWHCRRGMLELDLVLNRFMERHFDDLDAEGIDAFASLLARIDPELLDLVMGHVEASTPGECEVLALIREQNVALPSPPAPLPEGEGRFVVRALDTARTKRK